MLIQPDCNELGDKRLNPEEGLAKLKEENNAMVQDRRLYRQDEMEDPDRVLGPRLHFSEIIRRIRCCNPTILFKDGAPGQVAVYRRKTKQESSEVDWTKPGWYNDHVYVTGFHKDWIPEYGLITTDDHGVPKREEPRGWRSVLINLIKSRVVTYAQAVQHFGEAEGQRSWRWREQLRSFKYD